MTITVICVHSVDFIYWNVYIEYHVILLSKSHSFVSYFQTLMFLPISALFPVVVLLFIHVAKYYFSLTGQNMPIF